jgi:carbon monoxide dehydrogenase subunit G
MSVDVRHSIELARPAAEVFAVLADFSRNPEWQGGMVACRWTRGGPGEPGATYEQEARFLGRPILTAFEVVAVEPGRSVEIHSTQSTFPIQVTRSVEALGPDRCRVTAHVRGQPTGLLKLFGGMVGRSVRADYARLKVMLEG